MSLFGFYHFIILLYIWNICIPIIGIRTRKIVLNPFLLYFTIIYLFSLSSFLITNIHTTMNPSHTYIYQFCPKMGGFGAMFPYQIYQFVTTKYFLVLYTSLYFWVFRGVSSPKAGGRLSLYICSQLYLYYTFCDQVTNTWSHLTLT